MDQTLTKYQQALKELAEYPALSEILISTLEQLIRQERLKLLEALEEDDAETAQELLDFIEKAPNNVVHTLEESEEYFQKLPLAINVHQDLDSFDYLLGAVKLAL